jgi:DNA-binding response OmpR family regulator
MAIQKEFKDLEGKSRSFKILVIDDEAPVAGVLSRKLKEYGFQVWNAYNVEEALFWVEEEHFDVILVDLVLPGVSGYSIINYLRGMTHSSIFAMTGYASENTLRDVELLGAQGLLSKPFDMEYFVARLR